MLAHLVILSSATLRPNIFTGGELRFVEAYGKDNQWESFMTRSFLYAAIWRIFLYPVVIFLGSLGFAFAKTRAIYETRYGGHDPAMFDSMFASELIAALIPAFVLLAIGENSRIGSLLMLVTIPVVLLVFVLYGDIVGLIVFGTPYVVIAAGLIRRLRRYTSRPAPTSDDT